MTETYHGVPIDKSRPLHGNDRNALIGSASPEVQEANKVICFRWPTEKEKKK